MSLSDKSKENRAIARVALDLCETNVDNQDDSFKITSVGYYNLAANRFYYSCFQKLLDLANNKLSYEEESKQSGSSHINLINFIDMKINDAMKDNKKRMKIIQGRNIRAPFLELKDYRVISDYKIENIDQENIECIKNHVKQFDNYLSIIRNEL